MQTSQHIAASNFNPNSTLLPRVTERLETVVFDVNNPEHLRAFKMITGPNSKQHPKLRFHLEHPYLDVRAMMHAKVGAAFLKMKGH